MTLTRRRRARKPRDLRNGDDTTAWCEEYARSDRLVDLQRSCNTARDTARLIAWLQRALKWQKEGKR